MEAGQDSAERPSSELELSLLGGFRLAFEGSAITSIDAPRQQSLLAHLVLHRDQPQSRRRLAFLFWPESEEGQARTNLRQALHHLRRALPESERFVEANGGTVRWLPDAPLALDVAEFERHLAAAADARERDDEDEEVSRLEDAVATYGGDLFPDCYDDWIAPERERLRNAYEDGAARLAELLETGRDYRRAIPLARALLDRDPVDEDACERLMRLHALRGDRAGALRVYHGFATALAREIGVEPGAAIKAAYERLLEGSAAAPTPAGTTVRSPLVGRSREWEVLREAWRRASAGESLLAVVAGEAGIGKSRLAEELREWVGQQGFAAATSRCYEAAGGLAYAPIAELLRSPAMAPRVRRLGEAWLVELARLLPELLDEHPDLPRPPALTDDSQRARLLDGVSRAVLADGRPILLVIDDLQWADRETLGWLQYIHRSQPDSPLLVVVTARSEELLSDHPAQALLRGAKASGHAIELELDPLGPADTETLAANVSGHELDRGRGELIHRETEGNPLFVVEWMRAGLDDAVPERARSEARELPPRSHSVIEARLAQLSPAGQELASLAATVGRAFRFDVLAQASPRSEEQLVEALDELWERRIVRERGVDAYDFSHDKLREAAYARAGSARRMMLHRRVAQALERLHGADLDEVSGQLAAHYERVGWAERAIGFYARAAEIALRVYANEEAIDLFSRALELLDAEPPSRQRDERELELRTALGVPLVAIKGYGAPEVEDVYRRAWELCERLGTRPGPPVLRALAIASIARGAYPRARELGGQLLALGKREDDQMVRVEGNYVLGVTSFWLGEFAAARDQLELSIAEYLPERAASHLALYSQDPRIVCLSRLAYCLRFLEDPARAEERAREALRLADELEHPFSLAYALHFTTWLAIDLGDEPHARERAERMAALAEEQQLGFLQPMGTVLRGWMLAGEGQTEEAITLIREGLDAYTESGWTLYQPYCLSLLARVCLNAGLEEDGRAALLEAFELTERIGQRFLDADLHLLMGEVILAAGGDHAEAKSHLSAARDVARRQGATPLAHHAAERLERLRAVPS